MASITRLADRRERRHTPQARRPVVDPGRTLVGLFEDRVRR